MSENGLPLEAFGRFRTAHDFQIEHRIVGFRFGFAGLLLFRNSLQGVTIEAVAGRFRLRSRSIDIGALYE